MKNIINNFREYQIELNQAELTIKTYFESISETKVYDKWLETFITKVW